MSTKKPICSVCIANYNGEMILGDCIDSVLGQATALDIEILVHDDASEDSSVDLIKKKYPQVILIESGDNVGFCIANNRLVEKSNGEFILLLNNDAMLHDNALTVLHEAHLKYGLGIYGLPQFSKATGELIDRGSMLDLFLNPIPNLEDATEDVGMITGACMFLSKELWEEIGGFPEYFEMLAEDLYVSCVARLMGYPVKAIHLSGFSHWVGKNIGGGKITENKGLATTITRRRLTERNKTFVMIISYPIVGALVVFPLHIFALMTEGLLLALVKLDFSLFNKIYWNCVRQVYQRREQLEADREKRQKAKRISFSDFYTPFSLVPYKLKMLLRHGFPKIK